uniref:Small ribosomal subunit protein bS18c n=1 Tax=Caulerpa cliftonii TaxID=1004391 RepID=A0A1C9JBV3_9CHLO|nr:ribosomal protein S18 [Caulerpa cliftonii]AOP19326.1 ribosomal protein S18 [Caulerpa cliftonii]
MNKNKRNRKSKGPVRAHRLTLKKSDQINYKNIILLRNYITVSGKIIPKRLNNLTAKQQRHMSKAIKNARSMSFLPFVRLALRKSHPLAGLTSGGRASVKHFPLRGAFSFLCEGY